MKNMQSSLGYLMLLLCVYSFRPSVSEEEIDPIAQAYADKFRKAFRQANISENEILVEEYTENIGSKFNCPTALPSNYKPAESVHALTPYDISIVAGMGDSVTAAMGAGARTLLTDLIEYRGLSWSIGGNKDLRRVTTLPNILEEYNSKLSGYATGISLLTPKKLSVARSGAVAEGMLGQAESLVKKMDDMFGSREAVDSQWKVITLWIGGNDLCAICGGDPEDHAQKYVDRIERALDYLSNNVKRAYINLVLIVDVTELADIHDLICDLSHLLVCTCVDSATQIMSESSKLYNVNVKSLMEAKNNYNREDFTVVLQPFFSGTGLPQDKKKYFAPDCFHFNQAGHGIGAMYLWNNMLERVGEKTDHIDWENLQDFKCPTPEAPYFYTSLNSKTNTLLSANSGNTGNDEGSSKLPGILVGSIVGVATVALAAVLAVLVVIRHKRKKEETRLERVQLITATL